MHQEMISDNEDCSEGNMVINQAVIRSEGRVKGRGRDEKDYDDLIIGNGSLRKSHLRRATNDNKEPKT